VQFVVNQPGQNDSRYALVPVKQLEKSKQRLKSYLGADRAEFSTAMLKDVLQALADSETVHHILIVTADSRVAEIASRYGARVIDEKKSAGMNAALELGIETIRTWHGRLTLIFPADVPLLSGSEIDRLVTELEQLQESREITLIGITPSRDEGGTNLLCLPSKLKFPLRYGPDSFNQHRDRALETGCQPVTLYSRTIGLDIDEKKDLQDLVSYCRFHPEYQQTASWQYLQAKGYIKQAVSPDDDYGEKHSGSFEQ